MPTFWIRSMKNSKISQYGRSWAALRAHYTFSQELIRGVHMRWRLNFRLSFSSPCLIHWHNTNWIYLSKQAVFRPANYPAEHANSMSKIANGVRLRCEVWELPVTHVRCHSKQVPFCMCLFSPSTSTIEEAIQNGNEGGSGAAVGSDRNEPRPFHRRGVVQPPVIQWHRGENQQRPNRPAWRQRGFRTVSNGIQAYKKWSDSSFQWRSTSPPPSAGSSSVWLLGPPTTCKWSPALLQCRLIAALAIAISTVERVQRQPQIHAQVL